MKVKMLMAITADGKIAKTSDDLIDWTCKEDKKIFKKLTCESGYVIMGKKTFDTVGKPLPKRLNIIMTRTPKQFEDIPEQLTFTDNSPVKILNELKEKNAECVFICGGAQINSLFLKEKLVDELFLTIEPKIFGPGICLVDAVNEDINLKLLNLEKLGENAALLHYKILK